MATEKKIKARVLVDTPVGGKTYKPNQLVAFSASLARSLEKENKIDTSASAVSYCQSQKVDLVEHVDDEPAAVANADQGADDGAAGDQ